MILSRIEIDLANARGRQDLGDPYEMHSTLRRAFADPQSPGSTPNPFLWRIERLRLQQAPVVLVQSAREPKWESIEERSPGWARSIHSRTFDLHAYAAVGTRLRFRLRANPTVTRGGKRHALVREDDQQAWLHRQGERCGFQVEGAAISDPMRIVTRKRTATDALVVVHAVTWDGILRVRDSAAFSEALKRGIGHAKFLGLGLLSVALAHR